MSTITFYIFQVGQNTRNQLLVQAFEEACAQELSGNYEIHVIDIAKAPQAAEKHKILATPTISRVHPRPEKRIIGNLTHEQARDVIHFLTDDLTSENHVNIKGD